MLRARNVRLLFTAPVLVGLLASGCIFSPKEIQELCPDCTELSIKDPEALIKALELSYRATRFDLFETLLSPDYLFLYFDEQQQTNTQWSADEELRIHRRMFDPENPLPGEEPVPAHLWLVSVSITLTIDTPFVERPEFYVSESNPEGLDPARWKAEEAIYKTDVFFGTAGNTDFQVNGKARFVVIQDLDKEAGAPGSFLLYRWEDQDVPAKAGARSPA